MAGKGRPAEHGEPMEKVDVRVPAPIKREMQQEADERGVPLADVTREAIVKGRGRGTGQDQAEEK